MTIEYVDVESGNEYGVKVGTMLSGGDTSDVIMLKENDQVVNWQAQGFAAPLTDYIADYDMSGFVGIEKNYEIDSVQYGIPFRSDFWVLFYNKDLFDAAGIEYPSNDMTWDQYAELAKKMTDKEKDIYGTHYHTWLSTVANWAVCGGEYTLADGTYDNLLYFYKLYQDLEDSGACMSYADLKASGLKYAAAFENGNVAMLPMGYWLVSTLIADIKAGNASLNWGITAVPHADGVAAGSSFGNMTGAMINARSEQKDLAGRPGRREGDRFRRRPSRMGFRRSRGCHGGCGRLPGGRQQQSRAAACFRGDGVAGRRKGSGYQDGCERRTQPDHGP